MLTEITALVEFLSITLLVILIILFLDKISDEREFSSRKSHDDLPPNFPSPR
jgi:hypothetical protein